MGKKGSRLIRSKDVTELEAFYIAQSLVQYIMILVPGKIIIGGGVAHQASIFPLVRDNVKTLVNGYFNQNN